MAPPSPWTPDVIAALLRLDAMAENDRKISYGVMAAQLNETFGTTFNRNAIAGRIRVLRLGTWNQTSGMTARRIAKTSDPEPEPPAPKPVAPKPVAPKPAPILVASKRSALPKPWLPPQEPLQSTPVTLIDREPWQCRWPMNDGGPFLFCGARKGDYDPNYCPHHRCMATGRAVRRGEMVVGQ